MYSYNPSGSYILVCSHSLSFVAPFSLCPFPLFSYSFFPLFFTSIYLSLPLSSKIFVQGDLQWDIFQVIISRSTTPDLIKIGMKLQEFFTQQFDTSKRALSTWGPVPYLPPKAPVINIEKEAAELCKNPLSLGSWVHLVLIGMLFPLRLPFPLSFVLLLLTLVIALSPRHGCSPPSSLAWGSEGDRWVPHLPLPDASPRGRRATGWLHESPWQPHDPGLLPWAQLPLQVLGLIPPGGAQHSFFD